METNLFKFTLVNVFHTMVDGTQQCEPLEIVELNGQLVVFFVLN